MSFPLIRRRPPLSPSSVIVCANNHIFVLAKGVGAVLWVSKVKIFHRGQSSELLQNFRDALISFRTFKGGIK